MRRKRNNNRNPWNGKGWKIAVALVMLVLSFATIEDIRLWLVTKTASKGSYGVHSDASTAYAVSNSRIKNAVPKPLSNFHEAKKNARQLFQDHRNTFYCECKFDKHNHIDLASCGYNIQQDKRRAKRLEWEHIVPMSHLAAELECWKKPICCHQKNERDVRQENADLSQEKEIQCQEKEEEGQEKGNVVQEKSEARQVKCFRGRKCCQQQDAYFARMEADLHNLVPEIGELNALRSNYRFGELPQIKADQFGECQIKIDNVTRRIEPRAEVKGVIARAYLYMADTYDFRLSDSQRQLFAAWNVKYPPDAWEIEWDNRIFDIQGNHNLYITQYGERVSDAQ